MTRQRTYEKARATAWRLGNKYRAGSELSFDELIEFQQAVDAMGIIARALWIEAGRPEGSEFTHLRGMTEHNH